jgi:predicted ATPase
MLSRIEIRNFRSIRRASVSIPASGICAVVGANGSGKSNLVRALRFLASITHNGLDGAVIEAGGAEGLFPKAIPSERWHVENTSIVSRFSPSGLSPLLKTPRIKCDSLVHSIELGIRSRATQEQGQFDLLEETLEFSGGVSTDAQLDIQDVALVGRPRLQIKKGQKGGLVAQTERFPEGSRRVALEWLGLADIFVRPDAEGNFADEEVAQWLDRLGRPEQQGGSADSFLSRQPGNPLLFSPLVDELADYFRRLLWFDLQLDVLRREQPRSRPGVLGSNGSGLPAAVNLLAKDFDAHRRVRGALREIAPLIQGFQVKVLGSTKEYIAFAETAALREVESWEASDGTLRTLALLVAVATARSDSILLLEEPEIGLHPWAVRSMMSFIREEVERRHLQVLITTHSEHIIRELGAAELLVADRVADQGTEFVAAYDLVGELSGDELADLWIRGLLRGVPEGAD